LVQVNQFLLLTLPPPLHLNDHRIYNSGQLRSHALSVLKLTLLAFVEVLTSFGELKVAFSLVLTLLHHLLPRLPLLHLHLLHHLHLHQSFKQAAFAFYQVQCHFIEQMNFLKNFLFVL